MFGESKFKKKIRFLLFFYSFDQINFSSVRKYITLLFKLQ